MLQRKLFQGRVPRITCSQAEPCDPGTDVQPFSVTLETTQGTTSPAHFPAAVTPLACTLTAALLRRRARQESGLGRVTRHSATQGWQAQHTQAECKWLLISQDPRVGSGREQEWVWRFSRSANQATTLLFRHSPPTPASILLPEERDSSWGTKSERKKLHSNTLCHQFHQFKKDSQLLYIIFERRFPNFVMASLLMPLLTLYSSQNLLENSTERGSPMNRKPVKAAHKEKKKPTPALPHLFSPTSICTWKSQVLCLQSSHSSPLPIKLCPCLHLTRNSSLGRLLYRCQNTASSSLEKSTLVVSFPQRVETPTAEL